MNTAKLKSAAEKARWGYWAAYKPHSGARGYEVRVGIEAVAQHCLKDDAAFIAEASPKAVLELIAALEAADRRNAELNSTLERWATDRAQSASELEAAQKRIAELEARKLSVKLPKPHAHLIWIQAGRGPDDYWDDVAVSHSLRDRCCDGSERYPVYSIFEIQEVCAAAGINLETGGE
ncbi:ead/Ea22-like family protein [Cronobacter sakazakii]|uniref:ead/Ea22-like family protein n=1 Tax=Cronobacter sakazakii TaxID=28141 RepID=UPI0009BA39DF|nr:ead/Ea22-like family protein [Cronobacter sakazakii]